MTGFCSLISSLKNSWIRSTDRQSTSRFLEQPSARRIDCVQNFSYKDLATAADGFTAANVLGSGGFGKVYKGQLNSGQMVAIKLHDRAGNQGNKEFVVEILMLFMLRHPNIVSLIGYCSEGCNRILVYEYMPRCSLEDYMFENSILDWNTRVKIALGVAEALEYLHNVANPPVIYRDLKAANVLLDNDFNPKLSDFGLAKLGPIVGKTHDSTELMGTYGYCAPEYARTGKLTLKCDIYSFGVLLLELVSGRKAIDYGKPHSQRNLVQWSRPHLFEKSKFFLLADPLLQGRYPAKAFERFVSMALACLDEHSDSRPEIAHVVTGLKIVANQLYAFETD